MHGEESRYQTVGRVENLKLIVVIHTITDIGDEEEVRIISARRATPTERSLYEEIEP